VNGQSFPSPTNYTQADVCFGNHSDATFGSFAYAAPFVYVECEGQGLVALNVNTGTPSFSPCDATCGAPDWSAGGGTTFGPPIVAGGAVWAASDGGGLTAFNATTGAQIFQSAAFGMNRFSTPAEAGGQVFVASKTVIRTFNMQFNFTLTSLGGTLTTGPGSSSWGASRADAFVGGTDRGVWQQAWTGTSWSGWQQLGGVITADPTAAAWGTNRIDLVVRGTDNGLWHRFMDGTGWHPWEALGGVLTSSPSISSCATGTLDAWVIGTDGGLWRKTFSAGTWGPWQPEGGQWTSRPSATCR